MALASRLSDRAKRVRLPGCAHPGSGSSAGRMFHRRGKCFIGDVNHGFGVKMRLSGVEITVSAPKCCYRESKSRFRRQNVVIGSRNHGFGAKMLLSGVEITVSAPSHPSIPAPTQPSAPHHPIIPAPTQASAPSHPSVPAPTQASAPSHFS